MVYNLLNLDSTATQSIEAVGDALGLNTTQGLGGTLDALDSLSNLSADPDATVAAVGNNSTANATKTDTSDEKLQKIQKVGEAVGLDTSAFSGLIGALGAVSSEGLINLNGENYAATKINTSGDCAQLTKFKVMADRYRSIGGDASKYNDLYNQSVNTPRYAHCKHGLMNLDTQGEVDTL